MKMFVDGQSVDSHTGTTFDVLDPARGEKIDSVPKGDREDVRRAVDVAERAYAKWSETPAGERSRLLFKISEVVRGEAEELAKSLTNEQGKPLGEAKSEINSFANTC
ncbi:MAG: aldehyde dehydrogenase family protein, partial [Thaumarchaeota archaeon]